MEGQELYELWAQGMAREDVQVDDWEDVDDRGAWEFAASKVERRTPSVASDEPAAPGPHPVGMPVDALRSIVEGNRRALGLDA